MRLYLFASIFLVLLVNFNQLTAQMTAVSGPPFTPESLIETVFLGDGVEVLEVTYNGAPNAVGFFDNAGPFLGMESGVVMTTGGVDNSNGPGVAANGSQLSDVDLGINTGDPDLEALLPGVDINDVTSYTIRFIPFSDTLRFNFAFGSEEYPEFVCDIFNDVFGFFISGPGINGPFANNAENIALIPGTDFPVSISYVNPGEPGAGNPPDRCTAPNGSLDFSEFYVDNNGSDTQPVYDGYTTVFTAQAVVEPCQEYVIKLAIADGGDNALDSGVFLEARSFGGSDFDLSLTDLALDGTLAEGCRAAQLVFEVGNVEAEDRTLPLSYFGTATPGVDYTELPDNIVIPAGEDSVIFTVQAFEDNIAEGIETIQIVFQRNVCRTDTLEVRITDNLLVPSMLPDSVVVCPGDTVTLDATLPVVSPPPPRFESSGTVTIGIPPDEYSSFINLNNILPEQLQEGVIKSVCIDSLTHQWISDLDIFLVGPNGQALELTTDNGADGGNAFGEDAYINTCFTPNATNPITGPGNNAPASFVPFTGEWMPEGDWTSLYNGNFQTNGAWELRVIDDSNFGTGNLWKWSICLEPTYEINYDWSPGNSLSCSDCPVTDYLGEGETLYYVTATDSYGCELVDSVQMAYEPTPLMSEPSCGITTDSSITITWGVVQGALSYEIRMDTRAFINVGTDLSYTFNGLLPSTDYTFFVRAVFDPCSSPIREIACTTAPCIPPQLISTNTNLSCFESNDGTISTISATGGRNPYIYTLNGTVVPDGDFDNLMAGDYELIITDTVGCADTATLIITQPEAIVPQIETFQSIDCNGADNAILVANVSGGTEPYTYSWNGVVSSDTLSNLSPGVYVLDITDANNCMMTTQLEIFEPSALNGEIVQTTSQNCVGPPDGTIETNMLGGVPPYTYTWSDPNIGDVADPTGLVAGSYELTVTDANGCVFLLSTTVELEPDVSFSASETDILCNGAATGVINLQADAGQSPFTYDWTGPIAVNGPNPNNLVAGNYQVVITDNRGCLDTLTFSLTQPDTILGSAQTTDVNCIDPNSGSINWSGFGGVAPFTFMWSNGMSTEDLQNIPVGTYNLTVTDANGCQIEQAYLVDSRPAIEIENLIDPVECFGDETGGVFARVDNALPPFTTGWVRLGTTDTIAGLSLNGVAAGTYNLVGTDAAGCPINTQVVIPQPDQLMLDALAENIRCAGEANGLIELSASGGTPVYQYSLDQRDYRSSNVFIGLDGGTYNAYVRDDNGCVTEISNLEIIEPEPLELDLGDDLILVWGDSIQLIPNIQGGAGVIANYQWIAFDSTMLDCFDCAIVYAKPQNQTTIRLRITDDYGCTQEDFVTIFINKDFPVEVPTGFTPNNDGINDRLIVHGLPGTRVKSFQVFNRWGELIFEDKDFPVNDDTKGWNGEFKGQPVSGTFVWQLIAILPDGTEKPYSGQSTLIR